MQLIQAEGIKFTSLEDTDNACQGLKGSIVKICVVPERILFQSCAVFGSSALIIKIHEEY